MNIAFVGASPLVLPASGISELFIFQNGVEGQTNSVALDNIVISTGRVVAVPEGGSAIVLFSLGLLGLGFTKFRKSTAPNTRS